MNTKTKYYKSNREEKIDPDLKSFPGKSEIYLNSVNLSKPPKLIEPQDLING